MKTCSFLTIRRGLFFVLLCADLWTGTVSEAAVALTLNPSTISNTYAGSISMQITGLTNGETVRLERFIDANANATIDSGELLVQSFNVIDGRVAAFGGVRDTNVAGDEDGMANGQISTLFYLFASPEFGRGAGSYVFRLSSPTARFSPVTQPFTVTQTAYAQRITGTVTSGGSPVANADVALLIPVGEDIQFIAATLTDGAGNYSLNAAPGSYIVLAAKPGYVSDLSVAPMIALNSGQALVQNLTLTASTRTISGKVSDVASSNGIPGLQLFFQSDNNTLTFAFTDTNGDFTASVVSNQWKIDISDFSLSQTGYLRPQNKPRIDATTGNVTGVSIQLTRETALIYGYLRNDTNAPLPGISLSCNDNSNQYQAKATTDTNGYYLVGAIDGTWYVGPDNNNPALAGYLVQGTNVTVSGGQAVQVNFKALRATAHLQGRITDTSGSPVSDLTILAFSQNGGSSSATTAPDGLFDLGVFGGNWTVQLESSGAAQRSLIGPTLTFNVTDGVNLSNINFVVRNVTAQINGFVRNSQAVGLANVLMHASATIAGTNYNVNVQTDAGGNYQLGVINGTWLVGVDCFDLTNLGYGCPNEQTVVVNGANQTANFTAPAPAPAELSSPVLVSNNQFQFLYKGVAGQDYVFQYSATLTNWVTLYTTKALSDSFVVIDPSATTAYRFYRVRTP